MVISQGPDFSGGSSFAGGETINPSSQHDSEPVAIVGMGCRWPGACNQPAELWDLLEKQRDAYSDFPAERINVDAFYHEKRDRPGSFYTRGGCFLQSDPRNFDHTFFGINPQEATSIDPAQRKLLEAVYEAFESAGAPLEKISGSRTGCFVGNFNYDHQLMQYRDAEYPEPYAITGGGITILSNRITYAFNLSGPSLTMDTACSSSMYALHLACSALAAGDCTGAIVAGSNLILTPECQIFSSNLGAVSATSRCHTFDAAADGYARADGIGALYIKKLSDAINDHDPVRAVIRGTAVNSNGKTGGISHPSPIGQELAIRRAYERAGLDPASTDYVECHGTGTAYGDPLEVAAIGEVFAQGRSKADPLLIGSIKTNLGHSEPASGIAGIMKAVLALEKGIIPPVVGFKALNPNVDLKDGRIKIVTEKTPWPETNHVRRASVNSFGYGGANAHTILEAAESFLPQYQAKAKKVLGTIQKRTHRDQLEVQLNGHGGFGVEEKTGDNSTNGTGTLPLNGHGLSNGCGGATEGRETPVVNGYGMFHDHAAANGISLDDGSNFPNTAPERSKFLLVFSAHNARTLAHNIEAIRSVKGWRTLDLAYTLGHRRSKFRHRAFALSTKDQLDDATIPMEVPLHKVERSHPPKLCFVMTGQGAQWVNMGLELIKAFSVYSRTIKELDRYLQDLENRPAWTIEARNAIVIAYLRGVVVNHNPNDGSMLAVGITEEFLAQILERKQADVAIACYNGPENLTVSGDSDEIMVVKEELEDQKRFVRKLATDGNAYHSSHMKVVGPEYENEIIHSHAEASSPRALQTIPFISSVTTEELEMTPLGAHYWRANLESPVLFHQAIDNIVHNYNVDILIEIGPHSALRSALKQIAKSTPDVQFPDYIPTLVRESDGLNDLLNTAGNLFIKGYPVDLLSINSVETKKKSSYSVQHGSFIVDLPRYQWQYDKPLFYENRWTREWRLRSHARHDLLGSRIPGGLDCQPIWRNKIRIKDVPWLSDHCIGPEVVFPAAGYLAMALEAIAQVFETKGGDVHDVHTYDIEDVNIKSALLLPASDDGIEMFLTLEIPDWADSKVSNGSFEFVITSTVDHGLKHDFVEHARGRIGIAFSDTGMSTSSRSLHSDARGATTKRLSTSKWYSNFSKHGLVYGPNFQSMAGLKAYESKTIATAEVTDVQHSSMLHESRYIIHPAKLDAILQLSIIASHSGMFSRLKTGHLPVGFERMTFWPKKIRLANPTCLVHAKANTSRPRSFSADAVMLADDKEPIFEAIEMRFNAIEQLDVPSFSPRQPYSRLIWKPDFDMITTESLPSIYPKMHADISTGLNDLASKQIAQFHEDYPEFFKSGSTLPHLQKFLDWMKVKVSTTSNDSPKSYESSSLPLGRVKEIEKLATKLCPLSSECRIMCHMYEKLPSIFRGEMTGIQAALQNDLLNDLYEKGQLLSEGNRRLGSIIGFLSHKNPALRILEIGAGTGSATREVLRALKGNTSHRRYKEYLYTDITTSFLGHAEKTFAEYGGITYATFDMEKPSAEQGYQAVYDLVLASNAVHATSNIVETLRNIRAVLKPGGKLILLEITQSSLSAGLILGTFSDFWKAGSDPSFPRYEGPFLSKDMWREILPQAGFSGLDLFLDDFVDQPSSSVLVATAAAPPSISLSLSAPPQEAIGLVVADLSSPLIRGFHEYLTSCGVQVELCSLLDSADHQSRQYISLVEIEAPLFDHIIEAEWHGLQSIVRHAESLLWVTNGSLLTGKQPMFATVSGIVRGLKTEKQQLRLATLDLDLDDSTPNDVTFELIYQLHTRTSDPSTSYDDWEYRRKSGITYISRLMPDEGINDVAHAKAQRFYSTSVTPLSQIKDNPLQLKADQDGYYFEPAPDLMTPLNSNDVELEVKAMSIQEQGTTDVMRSGIGVTGVVRAVGKDVKDLAAGTLLYGISFSEPANYIRTNAPYCRQLSDTTSYKVQFHPLSIIPLLTPAVQDAATIPAVFATAAHALMSLARLRGNETVLIQSPFGGFALAALQIAQYLKAEVYFAVGDNSDEKALLSSDTGIERDHVILSSHSSPRNLLNRLGAKGVDVILTCHNGDRMQDYTRCLAKFGRLVEVGDSEKIRTKKTLTNLSRYRASFFSFDLKTIDLERPHMITE
ncbi:MAG: hypothetical protein Q9195_006465 [Heterodermia aff. obscurata]